MVAFLKAAIPGRGRHRPAAAIAIILLLSAFAPARAADPYRPGDEPLFGFVSEVRLGYAFHDAGVFGREKEDGEDVNAEIVFVSPDFLEILWSPRPHIGVHINNAGDTSQLYGGLTWDWWFWDNVFVLFHFGLSGHNGETAAPGRVDKEELGTEVLFREGLELGWNFYKKDSISVFLDHVSQGNFFNDENEGLDTFGLRYSYRF